MWVRVEARRDAQRRLQALLPRITARSDKNLSVAVSRDVSGSGGATGLSVKPYTSEEEKQDSSVELSFQRLKQIAPTRMEGVAGRGTNHETTTENIPVEIKRHVTQSDYYGYKYRDPGVPGGAAMRFGARYGDATIGTVVYDTVGDNFALCGSGHVANNYGYEIYQPKADNYYNPDDPNYIGDIDANRVREDENFDAAIINPLADGISTHRYHARTGRNEFSDSPIDGAVSKQRLHDLCDSGGELKKQGANTGKQSGTVQEVGDTYFTTTADREGGDSGGPHYEEQDGNFVIAGIHKGRVGDCAKATIMVEIEDLWKVRVVNTGGSCGSSSINKQDNTC